MTKDRDRKDLEMPEVIQPDKELMGTMQKLGIEPGLAGRVYTALQNHKTEQGGAIEKDKALRLAYEQVELIEPQAFVGVFCIGFVDDAIDSLREAFCAYLMLE